MRRMSKPDPAQGQPNPFIIRKEQPAPEPASSPEPAKSVPAEPEQVKPEPTFDKITSEQGEQASGGGEKVIRPEGFDADEAPTKPKGRGKQKKDSPSEVLDLDYKSDDEQLADMVDRAVAAAHAAQKTQVRPGSRVASNLGGELPLRVNAQHARAWLRERYSTYPGQWREDAKALGLVVNVSLRGEEGLVRAVPHLVDVLLASDFEHIAFRVTVPGKVAKIDLPWPAEDAETQAASPTVSVPDPRDGAGQTLNILLRVSAVLKAWALDFRPPPPDPLDVIRHELPQVARVIDARDLPGKNEWRVAAKNAGMCRSEARQKVVGNKAVSYEVHHAPKIVDWGVGPRGPWVDVEPVHQVGGQTVSDLKAQQARIGSVFRTPRLTVDAAGEDHQHARLNFNIKKLEFPMFVALEPEQFTRPDWSDGENSLVKAYHDLTWPVGVTNSGRLLEVNFRTTPHLLVAGTTGAGKSRTILSAISALGVQGAQMIVCSARPGDFEVLGKPGLAPGVLHVSTGSRAAILRATMYVLHEVERRKQVTKQLRRKGINSTPYPPLIFIIDEQAEFNRVLDTNKDPALKPWRGAIDTIARVGRLLRVHLGSASQDIYDRSFSGELLGLVTSRLALGTFQPMVRDKIFSSQPDAAEALMHQITKSDKGRGVVIDNVTGELEMIQSPYIYSPGMDPAEWNDANRENWKKWEQALAEVPQIAPRFAWAFPTGKAGAQDNWQEWTWEQLQDLRPIELDRRNPDTGFYEPIAERFIYDISHPDYAGDIATISGKHAPYQG